MACNIAALLPILLFCRVAAGMCGAVEGACAAAAPSMVGELAMTETEVQLAEAADGLAGVRLLQAQTKLSGAGLAAAQPSVSSKAQQCLRFMHIPRTAGTSLESENLHRPPGARPWESLMEGPVDEAFAHLGSWKTATGQKPPQVASAGELYDVMHGSELGQGSPLSAASVYGPYFTVLNWTYATVPEACDGCHCQDLHTPPNDDQRVADFYGDPDCTSFCVVRDPLQRTISAFEYSPMSTLLSNCTSGFELFVRALFPLTTDPTGACHFVPQTPFVFGAATRQASTKQYCDRVLRMENLTAEFNALMEEFGRDVRLGTHINAGSSCSISSEALSADVKDLIYDYYRADYEAFGYPRPV